MTTKDTALRLALEALEPVSTYGRVGSRDTDTAKAQQAITAIREALAQPAGEATGCACRWDKDDNRVQTCERHQGWLDVVHEWAERAKHAEEFIAKKAAALLSSDAQPSEWVGLTPAEAGAIWKVGMTPHEYAQSVFDKLREKNAGKPAAADKAGGDEPVAWRWPVKKLRGVEWRYSLRKTHQESEPLFTRHQPQGGE